MFYQSIFTDCFYRLKKPRDFATVLQTLNFPTILKVEEKQLEFKKITNNFSHQNKNGWKLNTSFCLQPFFSTAFSLLGRRIETKNIRPISSPTPPNQPSQPNLFASPSFPTVHLTPASDRCRPILIPISATIVLKLRADIEDWIHIKLALFFLF